VNLAKRFGRTEEIACITLFLAGTDSSFPLGAEIVADGGMSQPGVETERSTDA